MKRIFCIVAVLIFVLFLSKQTAKGEIVAYGSENRAFFSLNFEDGTKTFINCPVTHLHLAFAPDGTLYATSRNTDNLYRFTEPSTGELEYLAELPVNCTGGDTTVSPDGKGVYFTLGWKSKELFRYDIEDAVIESLGVITGADHNIYGLAFSADGILYGTTGTNWGKKRLYTIDLVTLQATAVGPDLFGIQMDPQSTSGSLDFAPDGTLYVGINIASMISGGEVYLSTINPQTGIANIDYNKRIFGILDSIAIAPELPTILEVAVDIKPGNCPNPLNVRSKGVLPVAILGSEDFDVAEIDVLSVQLAGVVPSRSDYEDVATPLVDANECECSAEGPDGYLDLTLKFDTQAIVEAIGEVNNGDEWVLELTGSLYDDTLIAGEDCIIIRAGSKQKSK